MGNSINFTGNLGRDAKLNTVGDNQVCNFSVANKVGFGDKAKTIWFNCALWGKQGAAVSQYLTKGKSVFISGELSLREYQSNSGEMKTSPEVRVAVLDFFGGRNSDEAQAQQQQAPAAQQQPTGEDMPF